MSRDLSKRRILHEGDWLRLISERGWEYIEHRRVRGIVVIIARTPDDRLLLVEQERIPLGRRTLELPAGMVGDRAGRSFEDAAEAARRELLEETGYAAARITRWFAGPMSPGRSADLYTFYLAEDLRKEGEGGGDEQEDIRVHAMPLADAERWLCAREEEGLLIDPKIFIGLYALSRIKAG
jgi:ADP-ribose pyrophosphatase